MLLVIAIFASIATCVLVFVLLLVAMGTNNRLTAIQRRQAEEFAWLRRAIGKPQAPSPGDQVDVARIGAPARIFQVGDHVAIIDGLHEGQHGTIVTPPDWLPEGVVCIELPTKQGPRYVEVSKLTRLDEATAHTDD
jgi:hypothetical protein